MELVTLFNEMLASIDIALGDRTKPYFLVVDGQSDIDDEQAAQAGGDLSTDPRIRVQTASGWQMMDPANGVGNRIGRNSIGFQAAKYILSEGYPLVYLVDLGTAGRPIEDWMGDGKDSELYVALKTVVETALSSLELVAAGITELSGFGWAQGGSNNMDSFEEYKEKLRTFFIDLLPTESWFSLRTPVAMQDIGTATGFNKMDGVITQDMMAEFPYILVYRTNDLARDFPGDGGNHLTGPAMDEAGRRMGANLLTRRPALPFTDKSKVFGEFTMWLEPFQGYGMKAIYDAATGQARLAAFNGSVGASSTNYLGWDFVAPGAARAVLRSSVAVDLLGPAATVEGNLFVGDVLRVSDIGHVRVGEFTAAQFDDPAAPVNTHDGKGRGALAVNVTNQALMRASGGGDTSGWYGTYPDFFQTPDGEEVPLAPIADRQPAVFETFEGFEAWRNAPPAAVPNKAMAFADGVSFKKDSSAPASAYLNLWVPPDDILTTNHMGSSSDIASDFKGIAEEMIRMSGLKGWIAHFKAPPDGTPFRYSYLDFLTTGRIVRIRGDRNAEFFPEERFQVFDCDGSTTMFDLNPAIWAYDGSSEGFQAGVIAADGSTETKLTVGTDISIAQVGGVWRLTTTTAPAGGTKLKVISARSAMSFSAGGTGAELHWDGHFRINLSESGQVKSAGGRSGLAPKGIDHLRHGGIVHIYGSPTSNFEAPFLDQRGDSGFVPVDFKTMIGNGVIIADYLCDCGIYVSGGGAAGDTSDDPLMCVLPSLLTRGTGQVLKDTREMNYGYAPYVFGVDQYGGYVNAAQDGISQGQNFVINHARFVKTRRTPVDLRASNHPVTINHLSVEDFGYEPDGEGGLNAVNGAEGIWFNSSRGATVKQAEFTLREWPAPEGFVVRFEGDECYGNRFEGVAIGYDNLVRNRVTSTAAAANSVHIRHTDATTLYTTEGGTAIDNVRHIFENMDTDERIARLHVPKIFLTEIYHGGETPPAQLNRKLEYTRDDNGYVEFTLDVQSTGWTFTPSGKTVRVSLPFTAASLEGQSFLCKALPISGLGKTGTNIELVGEIPNGQSYMEFRWRDLSGTSGGLLTDNDHTSNIRLKATGRYRAVANGIS
ncbi:hypothetical protein [Sulfitobacter alexandrii]|uniref:hypothetical protein n=1 Tax=Sulfitobacter alexandrii TaxID=1917485 RepID=UPI0012EC4803|nr:hypothetical protein [Sulfitobacter alexandrii]